MTKTAAILAAVLLAGCQSYSEIREREPLASHVTDKSPDDYLGCIAPRFIDINAKSTSLRDGDSWVVTLPSDGPSMHGSVTITPAGDGSRVEYRQFHDLTWGAFGRAREAVTDCL